MESQRPELLPAGFAGRIAFAFGSHGHRLPEVADKNRTEVRYRVSSHAGHRDSRPPRRAMVCGGRSGRFLRTVFQRLSGFAADRGTRAALRLSHGTCRRPHHACRGILRFLAEIFFMLGRRTACGKNRPLGRDGDSFRRQYSDDFCLRVPDHGARLFADATIRNSPGTWACSRVFVSGIVQTAGAFCTDWLRRHTRAPRCCVRWPGSRLHSYAWDLSCGFFRRRNWRSCRR